MLCCKFHPMAMVVVTQPRRYLYCILGPPSGGQRLNPPSLFLSAGNPLIKFLKATTKKLKCLTIKQEIAFHLFVIPFY